MKELRFYNFFRVRGSRPAPHRAFSVCSLRRNYCCHYVGYYFVRCISFLPYWVPVDSWPLLTLQAAARGHHWADMPKKNKWDYFLLLCFKAESRWKGVWVSKKPDFWVAKVRVDASSAFKGTHGDSRVCCPKTERRKKKVRGKEKDTWWESSPSFWLRPEKRKERAGSLQRFWEDGNHPQRELCPMETPCHLSWDRGR